MKKYLKYIISVCFLILCLIGIIIFSVNKSVVTNTFTSEILIFKNGVEYEVKVDNKTKETYFREDNIEEKIYSYPREPKYRLSIPKFKDIEGLNVLDDNKLVMDFTYSIPYIEGSKYIKYLLDEGYNIDMYVSTSQYFECFLRNADGYKRVVLFNDIMMVCDMDLSVELPNVVDYLQNYDFDGYIEKKFG